MTHALQGILDQQGRRTLSKLVYCLFTPALSFTKLAPVLSGRHLLQWMPLVVNMLFSVAVGLLLGGLLLLLVSPPKALKRHVMVATALGNAGNLPLVLVAALIRETGGRLFEGEVRNSSLGCVCMAGCRKALHTCPAAFPHPAVCTTHMCIYHRALLLVSRCLDAALCTGVQPPA